MKLRHINSILSYPIPGGSVKEGGLSGGNNEGRCSGCPEQRPSTAAGRAGTLSRAAWGRLHGQAAAPFAFRQGVGAPGTGWKKEMRLEGESRLRLSESSMTRLCRKMRREKLV